MLRVAARGHVHAFEPLPHLHAALMRRFAGDGRVTLYRF
jgi:hypothetical protein